jgi:hypothetical protein
MISLRPANKSPGEDNLSKRNLTIESLIVALILLAAPLISSAKAQTRPKGPDDIVALLEKSGYTYTKIGDGVWEIPGTGKNLKEFGIRVVMADDILLVMVKLADRKDLKLQPPLLTKLLELNHKFDSIKIALSQDAAYLRMDTHLRLLDGEELKYLVVQIANAADETYPQVKQYIGDAK